MKNFNCFYKKTRRTFTSLFAFLTVILLGFVSCNSQDGYDESAKTSTATFSDEGARLALAKFKMALTNNERTFQYIGDNPDAFQKSLLSRTPIPSGSDDENTKDNPENPCYLEEVRSASYELLTNFHFTKEEIAAITKDGRNTLESLSTEEQINFALLFFIMDNNDALLKNAHFVNVGLSLDTTAICAMPGTPNDTLRWIIDSLLAINKDSIPAITRVSAGNLFYNALGCIGEAFEINGELLLLDKQLVKMGMRSLRKLVLKVAVKFGLRSISGGIGLAWTVAEVAYCLYNRYHHGCEIHGEIQPPKWWKAEYNITPEEARTLPIVICGADFKIVSSDLSEEELGHKRALFFINWKIIHADSEESSK